MAAPSKTVEQWLVENMHSAEQSAHDLSVEAADSDGALRIELESQVDALHHVIDAIADLVRDIPPEWK